MLLDNIVFVTSMFYRSDWETVGGFKTNMDAGMEDYDFWLSILELGREIYQIPEVLFHEQLHFKKVVRKCNRFIDAFLKTIRISIKIIMMKSFLL